MRKGKELAIEVVEAGVMSEQDAEFVVQMFAKWILEYHENRNPEVLQEEPGAGRWGVNRFE